MNGRHYARARRRAMGLLCALSLPVGMAVATVRAPGDDGSWVLKAEDEYTITFVSQEDGYAWMLSCGAYVGAPVYESGVHYVERDAVSERDSAWEPDWRSAKFSNDRLVTGKWVYAALHRGELPKPFDESVRPPLANFGDVWRAAEGEDVCSAKVQAYGRELAARRGYPPEVLNDAWGVRADGALLYKVRAYRGGVEAPDLIDLKLSCRHGLEVRARVVRVRGGGYESHVYDAVGWGNGDARVVRDALQGRDVPTALGYTDVEGLVKLWPHFAATCPEAERAYKAVASSP